MSQTTKDHLLDAATVLFAERGFYGVSIANIADEVGLTKQALLHHFSTKEKLYGEVLERISQGFDVLRDEVQAMSVDPEDRLRTFLLRMASHSDEDIIRSRLLMRELLDNKRRAGTAGVWYLRPFLEGLAAMLKDVPAWADCSDAEAMAGIYQILGAINYFAVSEPTLRGVLGEQRFEALNHVYGDELERLIRQSLMRSSQ